MATEHASIAAFRAEHRRHGGVGEIVVLPDSVHTAALAAQSLGCEVGAIANSLLFEAAGQPVLILTSGAHRVNTTKAAAAAGVGRLRRGNPEFVRAHTGQVIGGVSPIAHPAPIATFVDTWLQRYPVLWAAAGHPAAVYSTSFDELVQMTAGQVIDVD